MSTVSEQLRQARESQNLTVHQVADITKIRTDHIRALEQGTFDVFSAPVYIRGFVRSYATLLKLDVPQTMAALDAELKQTEKFREPPPLSNEPRGVLDFVMLQFSRVDWRKSLVALGILVLAAVAVAVVVGWRQYLSRDPLKGLAPAVYQPARSNTAETLPLPAPRRK